MKLRAFDKMMIAAAGFVLLCAAVGFALQMFFDVPVTQALIELLGSELAVKIAAGCLTLVAVLTAVWCLSLLFRRRRARKGYVGQSTESGPLDISIKALNHLVGECLGNHPELRTETMDVHPDGDGVMVGLRIQLASGVSIPLAVNALQKQIRQYVTACTGLQVCEVHVEVSDTSGEGGESPYAIPSALQTALPVNSDVNKLSAIEAEEDIGRPAHQRMFDRDEQPVNMPEPPPEEPEEVTDSPEVSEAEETAEENETAAESASAAHEAEGSPGRNESNGDDEPDAVPAESAGSTVTETADEDRYDRSEQG